MIGIHQYIGSKTMVLIDGTSSCLNGLKKPIQQETCEQYNYITQDHFEYVREYRKTIDNIQQLKKENWHIVIGPKHIIEINIRITKNYIVYQKLTLLIKDLSAFCNII